MMDLCVRCPCVKSFPFSYWLMTCSVCFVLVLNGDLLFVIAYPSPVEGHHPPTAWVNCTMSLPHNHCHFMKPCVNH